MKTVILNILMLIASASAFSQNIINPQVQSQDDYSTRVTSIETNKQYTIVSFETLAGGDDAWFQLNKEIFIQTDQSNAHYNFVKSENIAFVPERTVLKKAGDKLLFKVYFSKIPAGAKTIDIIERAGHINGYSYFNFYNVSLTEQQPEGEQHVKSVDVVLTPPPPVEAGTDSIFNGMMPMLGNMTRAMMDAQLEYFKQPGKVQELAKLNKQYFDALVKEGFSFDQAIKVITAEGIMPKASMGK